MTKAQLIRVIIQLKDNTYTHDEMMRMTKKQLIDHFYRLADPTRFQERTEPYNPRYDEAYINEKIKKATKSWEGVDVDKFMDEMRGREVHSEALEKVAEEFAEGEWDGVAVDTDGNLLYSQDQIEYAFKAGAEWQASQMPMPEDTVLFQKGVAEGKRLMMEEAVEGSVNQDGILELSNGEAIDVCPSLDKCALGLQLGEKVKLIIVKDNDTE